MNNKFLISVDSGKAYTKGVIRNDNGIIEKILFRTKVAEVSGDVGIEMLSQSDSYLIEYDGKTYLVGDTLSEDRANYDFTKQTNEHLICIYLAITKLLERSKQSNALAKINLAVNIPLSLYKNETKKKEFKSFINHKGKVIGIAVNGKPYSFSLNSVLLLPEGLGPVYQNMDMYRSQRVLVIDIGSLNTSILEFNRLIPQYDRMVVSTLGINILRSTLAENLSSRYGITITDDDAEQILRDKCLYLNGIEQKDSHKIIQNIITNYVKSIFNYAKSRKITMTNTNLLLCGGGSILLKQHLLNEVPSATIISDAQFANVLSFHQVLEAKVNGKS
jgi:plasmid segregation protein ParM